MNLELMLSQIASIHKREAEISKLSGEDFNIFNILNLSSDEISHSSFIASLLDIKGTHGKGNKFLDLFLERIGVFDFSSGNVLTETEKFIGYISDDHESGGRLDISLTNDKSQQIIIENKIYAGDVWKQLLRYRNYNPNAHLIYLTLFGTDPSEESVGDKNELDYKVVSYREHILGWLEACKTESIDNPLLRETITQYINLIKQLTGQARSKKMQKEYMDAILKDASNVEAAFTISENIDKLKLQILTEKFAPLMKTVADELGFKLNLSLDNCFNIYWGFGFAKQEWKNAGIFFEAEGSNLQNVIYGISRNNTAKELDEYLRGLKGPYKRSKGCPLYRFMDEFRYWNNEFYVALYSNPEIISNVFKNKIKELLSIIEECKDKYEI